MSKDIHGQLIRDFLLTAVNIHFIDAPPDYRQWKGHSGGSNSEDSALTYRQEVQYRNWEDDIGY